MTTNNALEQLREKIALHMRFNNPNFNPEPGTADEEDFDAIMSAIQAYVAGIIGEDEKYTSATQTRLPTHVTARNSLRAEQRKRAGL